MTLEATVGQKRIFRDFAEFNSSNYGKDYHIASGLLDQIDFSSVHANDRPIPFKDSNKEIVGMQKAEEKGICLSGYEIIQNMIDHGLTDPEYMPVIILRGKKKSLLYDPTLETIDLDDLGEIISVDFVNHFVDGGLKPEYLTMIENEKAGLFNLGMHGRGLKIATGYLQNIKVVSTSRRIVDSNDVGPYHWVGKTSVKTTDPSGIKDLNFLYDENENVPDNLTVVRVDNPDERFVKNLLNLKKYFLLINPNYQSDLSIVKELDTSDIKRISGSHGAQEYTIELLPDEFKPDDRDTVFIDYLNVGTDYFSKNLFQWNIINHPRIKRGNDSTTVDGSLERILPDVFAQVATRKEWEKVLNTADLNNYCEFKREPNPETPIAKSVLTDLKEALLDKYGAIPIFTTEKTQLTEYSGKKIIHIPSGLVPYMIGVGAQSLLEEQGIALSISKESIIIEQIEIQQALESLGESILYSSYKDNKSIRGYALAELFKEYRYEVEDNEISITLPFSVTSISESRLTERSGPNSNERRLQEFAAFFCNLGFEVVIESSTRDQRYVTKTNFNNATSYFDVNKVALSVKSTKQENDLTSEFTKITLSLSKFNTNFPIIFDEQPEARDQLIRGMIGQIQNQIEIEALKTQELIDIKRLDDLNTRLGVLPKSEMSFPQIRNSLRTRVRRAGNNRSGYIEGGNEFSTFVESTGRIVYTIIPKNPLVNIGGYYISGGGNIINFNKETGKATAAFSEPPEKSFRVMIGLDAKEFSEKNYDFAIELNLSTQWQEIPIRSDAEDFHFFNSGLVDVEFDWRRGICRVKIKNQYSQEPNITKILNHPEASRFELRQSVNKSKNFLDLGEPLDADREDYFVEEILTDLSPRIDAIARKPISNEKKIQEAMSLIKFSYENDPSIHSRIVSKSANASEFVSNVIESGEGICNYAGLIQLAVIRRLGIPSRYLGGYVVGNNLEIIDGDSHAFVAYYEESEKIWKLADMYNSNKLNISVRNQAVGSVLMSKPDLGPVSFEVPSLGDIVAEIQLRKEDITLYTKALTIYLLQSLAKWPKKKSEALMKNKAKQ